MTKYGFETCYRFSKAIPSTVGKKTKKGDQCLSNRLLASSATKFEDDHTSRRDRISSDTNMVIKPEANFLFLRWRLSPTVVAESSLY